MRIPWRFQNFTIRHAAARMHGSGAPPGLMRLSLAACLLGAACWQAGDSARAEDAPSPQNRTGGANDAGLAGAEVSGEASSPTNRIDELVSARLREAGMVPALPSSDSEFARRIYLDLVGRIPSLAEYREFMASPKPDKRARLIDELLECPQHVRHLRNLFDSLLIGDKDERYWDRKDWLDFLERSIAENKPWDRLVRELLLSDGTDPKTQGATAFFVARRGNVDAMTTDSSRLFLGVQIQCARCHDHPMVFEWTQDHYYGMAAFWARSSIFKSDKHVFIGEKAEGTVKFQPIGGEEITARPMFLTGEVVTEPELDKEDRYVVKPAKESKLPPRPRFSLRERFAELTTNPQNPYFQKAIVNRMFKWLIGRGLVEPVDNMNSENPASHPELLDALGRDFAEHGFDLRHLIRTIVRSETYQRSSRWDPADKLPDESLLAYALLKPLTAEQLALSLMQACGRPEAELLENPQQSRDELRRKQQEESTPFLELFAPGGSSEFQATAEQALFLTNSDVVNAWVEDDRPGSTRRVLLDQDDRTLIDTLFRIVLSRDPDAEERETMSAHLEAQKQERGQAVSEMIWALLTSSEFRFNH